MTISAQTALRKSFMASTTAAAPLFHVHVLDCDDISEVRIPIIRFENDLIPDAEHDVGRISGNFRTKVLDHHSFIFREKGPKGGNEMGFKKGKGWMGHHVIYHDAHSDSINSSMKFGQFFKAKVIEEISSHIVDKLPQNVKELLSKNQLPFNNIFGDKLRLAEPLMGGKQYADNISSVTDDYEFDFEQWVGYKLTDTDKKNPVKIGKVLSKKLQDLQKQIKAPDVATEVIGSLQNQINHIDKLLKTTNLQKQYQQSQTTSFYIVYSRAPIDVARMGDFNWRVSSCHAPDGDYFHCALADAMMNAGVIYLVDKEAFLAAGLDQGEALQEDEIFIDRDRDVDGLDALARMRIRLVIDRQGNQLAVPTTKLYAKRGYEFNDDFIGQAYKWAKQQEVGDFNWEDTLTLKGGSYEDYNYDVASMVKKIWGKVIKYRTSSDDEQYRGEGDDDSQEEEQFWDSVREELADKEDETILEKFFDQEDYGNDGNITIAITHGGNIRMRQYFDTAFLKRLGGVEKILSQKEKIDKAFGEGKVAPYWSLEFNASRLFLKYDIEAPNMYEHGDFHGRYEGGNFSYDDYNEACRDILEEAYKVALKHRASANEKSDLPLVIRNGFNDKLAGLMGEPEPEYPTVPSDIISSFRNGDFDRNIEIFESFPLNEMPELFISSKQMHQGRSNISISLGDYDLAKLKSLINTAEDWVYNTLCSNYDYTIYDLPVDVETILTIPSEHNTRHVSLYNKDNAPPPSFKIELSTSVKIAEISIRVDCSDLSNGDNLTKLIDGGTLGKAYTMADGLQDMSRNDDIRNEIFDEEELENMMSKAGHRLSDNQLLRNGQMEFDFSSLQRTGFDGVVREMLMTTFGRNK